MKGPGRRLREQALVLRCQAGDDDAFEELVAEFHGRMRSFVKRVLGSPDNTEDVLQETWLAVYRKLPSLRSPRAIRSWLFRIVRNKIAYELRKGRVPTEPLDVADLAEPSEPEPAFQDEDVRLISECLAKLPPEHREVVFLRFIEDMSYEEIAHATNSRLGTVRSRLYYAKRALKEEIQRMRNERR